MDGLIPVNKTAGYTSHDIVAVVRRMTNERACGHTGTLDPGASGVLVLCMGKATRLSRFLTDMPKSYEAEVVFGTATATGDSEGEVVSSLEHFSLEPGAVVEALQRFTGHIMQIPPMVSAVHYEGRRLYELAREGVVVDRKAREVTIHRIEPIALNEWPDPIVFGSVIKIDVACSKGTYIRTLCEDVCASLGVPGHMGALARTEAAGFRIDDAVTLEQIQHAGQCGEWERVLKPMELGITHLVQLRLNADEYRRIRCGNRLYVDVSRLSKEPCYTSWIALLNEDGGLAAIAEPIDVDAKEALGLQPRVVF